MSIKNGKIKNDLLSSVTSVVLMRWGLLIIGVFLFSISSGVWAFSDDPSVMIGEYSSSRTSFGVPIMDHTVGPPVSVINTSPSAVPTTVSSSNHINHLLLTGGYYHSLSPSEFNLVLTGGRQYDSVKHRWGWFRPCGEYRNNLVFSYLHHRGDNHPASNQSFPLVSKTCPGD